MAEFSFTKLDFGESLMIMASLVAQRLKPLPPMQETQVRSLGQEDPLEKEMATHSSILVTYAEQIIMTDNRTEYR